MKIDTTEVKNILVNELNYKEDQAESFINNFPSINEALAPALTQWLKDRTIVNTDFAGITIEEVMRNRNAHFLMAIQEINRLYDKDITEDKKSRSREILKKTAVRW